MLLLSALALRCDNCPDGSHPSLDAWLECDDCLDARRAEVHQLGVSVIPLLRRTLRDGPSAERRRAVKQRLGQQYHVLRFYRSTHPEVGPLPDSADFVAQYLSSFVDGYRVRSALALAVLRVARADEVLQAAAQDTVHFEGYVAEAVRCARDSTCFR